MTAVDGRGGGEPEIDKARFDAMLDKARKINRARREEQDRIGDAIEQLLYEAKGTEAIDMLVRLARIVFEPPSRR